MRFLLLGCGDTLPEAIINNLLLNPSDRYDLPSLVNSCCSAVFTNSRASVSEHISLKESKLR